MIKIRLTEEEQEVISVVSQMWELRENLKHRRNRPDGDNTPKKLDAFDAESEGLRCEVCGKHINELIPFDSPGNIFDDERFSFF